MQPTINLVWESQQRKLISELMEEKQGLILGGDGRADSPGHSAKYGSYSIIDLNKNKVVHLKLVQVIVTITPVYITMYCYYYYYVIYINYMHYIV